MPRNFKYVKTRQKMSFKHFAKNFLSFIIVLIVFATTIFMANVFSGLLTVKTISNLSFKASTKTNKVYAISMLSSQSREVAVDYAEHIKQRLAAGYIFAKDNTFYVLASAYPKKEQAQSVKEKLIAGGENAEILEITLNSIALNMNLTDDANLILSNSLDLFYNSFITLLQISFKVDGASINSVQAKTEIKELFEGNLAQISKFNEQFKSNTNIKMAYIKIFLTRLNDSISSLLDVETELQQAWEIKHKYLECIFLYNNLEKEI